MYDGPLFNVSRWSLETLLDSRLLWSKADNTLRVSMSAPLSLFLYVHPCARSKHTDTCLFLPLLSVSLLCGARDPCCVPVSRLHQCPCFMLFWLLSAHPLILIAVVCSAPAPALSDPLPSFSAVILPQRWKPAVLCLLWVQQGLTTWPTQPGRSSWGGGVSSLLRQVPRLPLCWEDPALLSCCRR